MNNYKKLPSMGFAESVNSVLKNMLNFNGRSRRSELWWYFLAYMLVCMICSLLLSSSPVAMAIISTILLLSLWSVTVRRLHDREHSSWWVTIAILVSIFTQFYIINSGYYEIMSAVNPNIEDAIAALSGPVFSIAVLISGIMNITIFVFCVLDSKPEPNKYGNSPKYVSDDEL